MNHKEAILEALQEQNFPNLQFLFSSEVLDNAEEVLEDLLQKEKDDFQDKLNINDVDISFNTFRDFSLLDYFFSLLEHYQGVNSDEKIRKIIENFEPKYIAFGNEIAYSKRYYEMMKYCYENQELNHEEKRILETSLEAYEVRGIALKEEKQKRLKEISQELSELSQVFSNNVLDSQKEFEYIIEDESVLVEMPEDDIAAAKKRSEEKEKSGYLFDASQGSYIAVMKYCNNSQIRKDFYEARNNFGSVGKYDNRPTILKILNLRSEKAKILGYKNYGELSLHFKMADSPEQILELFGDIASKAKNKAQSELDEIRNYFELSELRPWDLSYFSRKLKQEKYALDDRELKKYFLLENVLDGLFDIVKRLYNVELKKIDTKIYDKHVEVYEVYKDGNLLSYFFTDYFYRPLKRQGAWANILREKFGDNKKITCNVCNFQQGTDGNTLLTLGDVETLFHEFGHAIHEMLSMSEYSELSGFHVEWDFIELPSQLMENWCRDRQGMTLFAKHYQTGTIISEELLEGLEKLENFGNGNFILKQNEYAMMDMELHMNDIPTSENDLDKKIHKNYSVNSLFPLSDIYSPHTSFSHIFDGGYAAGYYSYMWAEIIEKEVWNEFKKSGNIFNAGVADKFYQLILSAGSTKKAIELFKDFFQREVQIDAFLEEKGLI